MYQPNVIDSLYEYDPDYDTRTNSRYGSSRIGFISGPILILLGIAILSLTLADMDRGIYNNNRRTSGALTLTWTENPYYPTYGKGLWVGLLMIAIGLLGIIAHYEESYTSIKVYGVSCLILTILVFYMLITCIKEVEFGQVAIRSDQYNSYAIYNTFALNCAIIGLVSFTFIVTLLAGILSLSYIDFYSDSRLEPIKQS